MREVSVGENLDQYKLIEVIARSGMASIFKAIDQVDGKTVAIKVPYMQFESDVVFYGRFQREEEVGRRLNHPGIVKVLAPRKKSRMYIAMEYIEGDSLRAMMREPGLPAGKGARACAAVGGDARVYARRRRGASRYEAGKHPGDG